MSEFQHARLPDAAAEIAFDDFVKVDMRVGRVVKVEESSARKPSWKLTIDFGPLGVKTSSAAIRSWYAKEDLEGRLVVAVVNFPARQVGPVRSECLTLGAITAEGRVRLLAPEGGTELGARVG